MDALQNSYLARAQAALGMLAHDAKDVAPEGTFKRDFVRSVICRNFAGLDPESAQAFAQRRWPWAHPDTIAKAAVSAVMASETGDRLAGAFLASVQKRTVLGRLPFRQVPFDVRLVAMTSGARGYWVGQARPKPLSKPALVGSTLMPTKVAAIIVLTNEALASESPLVEKGVTSDLERAVVGAIDDALLNPDNAGVADQMPAAITYGVAPIPSSGADAAAVRADLQALFAAYNGDLETAAILMAPRTALQISLLQNPFGTVNLTLQGGTLFGLPVATSDALAGDSDGAYLALVDTLAVAYGLDRISINKAEHATLQMADDPEDGSTEQVSLWQNDLTGLRSEVFAGWEVQRPGSIVVVSGVDYVGES